LTTRDRIQPRPPQRANRAGGGADRAQAFVASQIGFALGGRISDAAREGTERLAGAVLILIAAALLVARFLGHPI